MTNMVTKSNRSSTMSLKFCQVRGWFSSFSWSRATTPNTPEDLTVHSNSKLACSNLRLSVGQVILALLFLKLRHNLKDFQWAVLRPQATWRCSPASLSISLWLCSRQMNPEAISATSTANFSWRPSTTIGIISYGYTNQ